LPPKVSAKREPGQPKNAGKNITAKTAKPVAGVKQREKRNGSAKECRKNITAKTAKRIGECRRQIAALLGKCHPTIAFKLTAQAGRFARDFTACGVARPTA
jgi:hypothetical protein